MFVYCCVYNCFSLDGGLRVLCLLSLSVQPWGGGLGIDSLVDYEDVYCISGVVVLSC